jgi:vacuolar-type H+-ATPase subunit D/Vma8
MLLIDTSVWISIFRDQTGQVRQHVETLIADRKVLLTRFTQLELLQGSLNEQEWILLSNYLKIKITLNLRLILGHRLPVFTMTFADKGLPFAVQLIAALPKPHWRMI